MKKIISLFIVLLALSSFTFLVNDCGGLIFFKDGTSTVMTSYSEDGKVIGSAKTIYTGVTKTPGGASVKAQQENFDKKGKSTAKSEFTITCDHGNLIFDMKMMMPQEQAESYKDMEMTMEGNNKELPSDFVVGSSLKDATIKFKFKTKDGMEMSMMNMSFKITNRKVEAKETITTPAGTFECYKLTEDIEMKTMFAMKMKSVSWFNVQSGTIKTETYKENGKYTGKSELTEIK